MRFELRVARIACEPTHSYAIENTTFINNYLRVSLTISECKFFDKVRPGLAQLGNCFDESENHFQRRSFHSVSCKCKH